MTISVPRPRGTGNAPARGALPSLYNGALPTPEEDIAST
jgi:hypothetical protein